MTNYKLHNDCKILSQRVYPENRQEGTNGWSYKGTYSNHRTGFYSEIYTKNNKAILVIRGTEMNSGGKEASKDALSDFQMGLGYLPHQMKDAENAYLKIIREYGMDNVILTGHSLGGSEAQILGAKYGAETVTFGAYGVKNFNGVEVNYVDNITNYGNSQDGIFIQNIDNQIGKTLVLNTNAKIGDNFGKGYKYHGLAPHSLENLGDLSKAVEYKKEVFELDKTPLFKTGIEYIDYNDDVFDTRNRVLYGGEVPFEEMDDELLDVYLDQYYDNDKMPTKDDLDKRVHIEQGKATILNKEGAKEYLTTLNSCTCSDYKERKLPCKHIYRLAGLCGSFNLFADEEYETIQRLMPLWSKLNLCSKLIDVFYRVRDSKNKYYIKTSPLLKELEQMQYITITEIPDNVYIDFKYNANELRGMLIGKDFKKSSSKKELVDLIISDPKLLKKISKPLKQIKLNFNEKQTEYLLECLNYICYHQE